MRLRGCSLGLTGSPTLKLGNKNHKDQTWHQNGGTRRSLSVQREVSQEILFGVASLIYKEPRIHRSKSISETHITALSGYALCASITIEFQGTRKKCISAICPSSKMQAQIGL